MVEDNSNSDLFIGAKTGFEGARRKEVRGASVKITRAASQSFGKSTHVEMIGYVPEGGDLDWVEDNVDRIGKDELGAGVPSKFGIYADTQEKQGGVPLPIEASFGMLTEADEDDIRKSAAQGSDPLRRRVTRDPVTRIPENTSWADRQPESDNFFGEEKPVREFDSVRQRQNTVERKRESVDYGTASAIPIKVMRGQ